MIANILLLLVCFGSYLQGRAEKGWFISLFIRPLVGRENLADRWTSFVFVQG